MVNIISNIPDGNSNLTTRAKLLSKKFNFFETLLVSEHDFRSPGKQI